MIQYNIENLVKSALDLFDPIACLDVDYGEEVATLTEFITTLQISNPQEVMELDPQTLANLMEQAQETGRDISEVILNFCNEKVALA